MTRLALFACLVVLAACLLPDARAAVSERQLVSRLARQRAALWRDESTLRFFANHPRILWTGPLRTRRLAKAIVRYRAAHRYQVIARMAVTQRALIDLRHSVIPWPWDAIAECESGGDYRFGAPGNPNGDGYYQGAVNWAPSTWDAAKRLVAGASAYPDAWDAPAWVQVAVAQAWLERTSWDQWPACSARLGLR